jgi:hypothetical protein
LAAKRFAPRTSLGWLLAAPMFPELISPPFVLRGVEVVPMVPGDTPADDICIVGSVARPQTRRAVTAALRLASDSLTAGTR